MKASSIRLDGKDLFVEIVDAEFTEVTGSPGRFVSQEVTALDRLEATQQAIYNTVHGMAGTVRTALEASLPAEFSIEFNLAFGGGVTPIPFMVSADAKAAVKIKATWKNPMRAAPPVSDKEAAESETDVPAGESTQ